MPFNISADADYSSTDAAQIIVAGAGIGGISAAIASARLGARTLLLDKMNDIGGTGVHSPVGLICTYFDKMGHPINSGLHREFFPHIYEEDPFEDCQTYDETELAATYKRLVAAEPNLRVKTGAALASVRVTDGRVEAVELTSGEVCEALVFVDSTAEGDLSALAGAQWEKGRAEDGAMQPATLTFRAGPVDMSKFGISEWRSWKSLKIIWGELKPYFEALHERGGTSNPNHGILCFPDRRGQSLLFNQTRVTGVDPTDSLSLQRARQEGEKQVHEFWNAVRAHPALHQANILHVSEKMGIREGRRILGDYVLSERDCLGEARFQDMIAACGYALDIHNPLGGGTRLVSIPGSGYYHIPYRCLTTRGYSNLLLGSRCISGTHEAHSSYRVMAPISAIGQAAGTAAALYSRLRCNDVREVNPAWIRAALAAAGQFVEGSIETAPI